MDEWSREENGLRVDPDSTADTPDTRIDASNGRDVETPMNPPSLRNTSPEPASEGRKPLIALAAPAGDPALVRSCTRARFGKVRSRFDTPADVTVACNAQD